MKSQTRYLTFQVPERMGFLNITSQVEGVVAESGEIPQIFYGEFDGRRPKRILVKVIGE